MADEDEQPEETAEVEETAQVEETPDVEVAPDVEEIPALAETPPALRFLREHLSSVAFVGGFAYDAVTLRRIDSWFDNALLALYLLALAVLLVLERRKAWSRKVPALVHRFPRALDFLTQFLFGGLFSAYVVFYFKSSGAFRSFVFLGLLAVLMVLNEYRDGVLRRIDSLRVGLFFFVAFSFFQFFLPVVTGIAAPAMTVAALAAALALSLGVVFATHFDGPRKGSPSAIGGPRLQQRLLTQGGLMLGLAGLLLGLARAGVIPPVPVSVTARRVAYSVQRDGADYRLMVEERSMLEALRLTTEHLAWAPGQPIAVFTAVFAPRGTSLEIVHRWQHEQEDGTWQETDRIPFEVLGGRDGGFRGYTRKRNLSPGLWRITTETADGRPIGSLKFVLEPTDPLPEPSEERL